MSVEFLKLIDVVRGRGIRVDIAVLVDVHHVVRRTITLHLRDGKWRFYPNRNDEYGLQIVEAVNEQFNRINFPENLLYRYWSILNRVIGFGDGKKELVMASSLITCYLNIGAVHRARAILGESVPYMAIAFDDRYLDHLAWAGCSLPETESKCLG